MYHWARFFPLSANHFTDASEKTYVAAVYARSIQNNEETILSIVMPKSQLVPLSSVSISAVNFCDALFG